jgi:hypothetical protein
MAGTYTNRTSHSNVRTIQNIRGLIFVFVSFGQPITVLNS